MVKILFGNYHVHVYTLAIPLAHDPKFIVHTTQNTL